ncbi:MAG: site-2 protease family protein [Candidatus Hadarchaeaceae archaeon]
MSALWWLLVVLAALAALWTTILLANRRYDLKKRGFTISPGIIMWRTKRGLRFIDRVAKSSKRGWRAFGTVAAAIGIFLMAFVFFNVSFNAVITFTQPVRALPGVRFVLPGIVPGLTIFAWLVGIASVLFVHEFAHGFVLRAQGLETKSVGGMLFVAIPGAFVEPDEEQLKKAPILKRLRVFGAGSFANVLFAFLCLGILLLLLVPKPGVYISGVAENYPAENVLDAGMHIYSIDNVLINTYEDFSNFMGDTKPGQIIQISTDNGNFQIELTEHPENENRGFIGVGTISAFSHSEFTNPLFVGWVMMSELTGHPVFHSYVYHTSVPWGLIDIIKWMFVLNFGIGLFNLLPAVPLDGGYIFQGMIERASSKETARRVSRALSLIVLALIIVNFMPMLS